MNIFNPFVQSPFSRGIPVDSNHPMPVNLRADPYRTFPNGSSTRNDNLRVEHNERDIDHPYQDYAYRRMGVAQVHNNIMASHATNSEYRNAALDTITSPILPVADIMQPQYFNSFARGYNPTRSNLRRQFREPLLNYTMEPPIGTLGQDLRRQYFPTPIPYQYPYFGLGVPFGEPPEELEGIYGQDLGRLIPPHRSIAPAVSRIPMLNDPILDNMMPANIPRVPLVDRIMAGASSQYLLQRPYSYAFDAAPYPHMRAHADALVAFMHNPRVVTSIFVDILAKGAPEEMEALRFEFFRATQTQLHVILNNSLELNEERSSVKYALMGLAMGPILFDVWLLQNNVYMLYFSFTEGNYQNLGDNKDILIDIFVGRHPEDLLNLELKYRQQTQMSEPSFAADLINLTNDPELQAALKICCETRRPGPLHIVNSLSVQRHVDEIIDLVETRFPNEITYQRLFNILLRSSGPHIIQIAIYYELRTGMKLDEAVSRNMRFRKMTKKILVHAIRTAKDLTCRDAMLLRDSLRGNSTSGRRNNEKLAIRVVRMHWYKQHWKQVMAAFTGTTGKMFSDKLRNVSGLLGELMRAMCENTYNMDSGHSGHIP